MFTIKPTPGEGFPSFDHPRPIECKAMRPVAASKPIVTLDRKRPVSECGVMIDGQRGGPFLDWRDIALAAPPR